MSNLALQAASLFSDVILHFPPGQRAATAADVAEDATALLVVMQVGWVCGRAAEDTTAALMATQVGGVDGRGVAEGKVDYQWALYLHSGVMVHSSARFRPLDRPLCSGRSRPWAGAGSWRPPQLRRDPDL